MCKCTQSLTCLGITVFTSQRTSQQMKVRPPSDASPPGKSPWGFQSLKAERKLQVTERRRWRRWRRVEIINVTRTQEAKVE